MLQVNATAGPSQIHGIGLIAREFIPKGTTIWTLREGFDVVLSPEQLEGLTPSARRQVLWYAYFDPRRSVYVLSSDDDRFTNHSDDPNSAEGPDGYSSVAVRDIAAGEEITWSYHDWVAPNSYDGTFTSAAFKTA